MLRSSRCQCPRPSAATPAPPSMVPESPPPRPGQRLHHSCRASQRPQPLPRGSAVSPLGLFKPLRFRSPCSSLVPTALEGREGGTCFLLGPSLGFLRLTRMTPPLLSASTPVRAGLRARTLLPETGTRHTQQALGGGDSPGPTSYQGFLQGPGGVHLTSRSACLQTMGFTYTERVLVPAPTSAD